jgi:hypothetical protein
MTIPAIEISSSIPTLLLIQRLENRHIERKCEMFALWSRINAMKLAERSLDMTRIGLRPIPYRTKLPCEADHIMCCDLIMGYADFIVPIQVSNCPVPTIKLSDDNNQKSKER